MPRNLLIVEDDPDTNDTLGEIFTGRGYRTWRAPNGLDAIELVHRYGIRPDAIILDLMMPVMDGLEFLEHRTGDLLLATAPVIVMSAQLDRLGRYRSGVYAALAKPIDRLRLLDAVERACNGLPSTS